MIKMKSSIERSVTGGPRLVAPLARCCWLLAAVVQLAAGLPNLRIQVNNENLQSPPYLLDAIERASSSPTAAAAALLPPPTPSTGRVVNEGAPGPQADPPRPAAASSAGAGELEGELAPAETDHSMALIREETIEEMLDLEPESVLKLSPGSLIESVAVHESGGGGGGGGGDFDAAARQADSGADDESANSSSSGSGKSARLKSQLPVTSSHLKRPLMREHDDERAGDNEDDQSGAARAPPLLGSSDLRAQKLATDDNPNASHANAAASNSAPQTADAAPVSGAKSRVSPSVAGDQDEGAASATEPDAPNKRTAAQPARPPPDTWEPSQVMAGVTNASLVPASVRRQYGHQTRTRITLGGGYQRNKLPPVGLADEDQGEQRRPVRGHESRPAAAAGSQPDSSRVIEVPERIVVPASVFRQQQQQTQKLGRPAAAQPTNASVVRKRDSRCPSNGIVGLEHPAACDKYLLCEDGLSSERTCPNGLMYGTRDVVRDNYCVHRWQVVCGDKSMPNPISSPGCRWQNGIFNVQGSPKCTPDYYECTDGVFEVKKCSLSGQVYDDKTKSCQFAEQVGCAQEALAEFRCPADDQTNTYWPFPRYFLNERALIHCINDKPEIIRCRDHERVDPEHLFCVPIDKATSAAEAAASVEITERRTPNGTNNGGQGRERAKEVKLPATPATEDDHSNE